jgi:UDP-glucuronate 4-epimerase
MAMYKFADAIATGQLLEVYNNGEMRRDFMYIDDIVEGVLRVVEQIREPSTSARGCPLGNIPTTTMSPTTSEIVSSLNWNV